MMGALLGGVLFSRTQIEPDEHAVLVGQITDDFTNGLRQLAHQRGHGDDLIAARESRVLHEVDDLDTVAGVDVSLADLLEIRDGEARARPLALDAARVSRSPVARAPA